MANGPTGAGTGLDLGSIIDMFGSLSEAQAQQTQQIAANQAQQGERARIQAEATREAADLTAKANLTQRRAEMEARNASRRNATSMGMNALDMSEIITSTSEQLRADRLAFQVASQEVQQIEENANLLSNPLGWLNDVLNGDEARARRDNIEDRHDATARQLANMHSLAQANVQTQLSIAETQTEASINQLAQAERAKAEVDAQQRSIEALGYTSASIDTLRQQGSLEFNRRLQLNSAIRQEEQFQQSMAMQRQQFALQQRKFAAEEAELESWQTTIQKVQVAQRAMNIPVMDEGTIRRVYGQNTPMGTNVRELEWMGHVMENRDNEVRLGDTPAESYERLNRFGGNPPPAAKPAMDILDSAATELDRITAEITSDPTGTKAHEIGGIRITSENVGDAGVQAQVFNALAAAEAQKEAANQAGRPIPITNVLSEFPNLAQMPLAQKIINPMIEAGETEMTAEDIYVRAATMFTQNKLTHNEARDGLVEFFNSALALDNAYSWKYQVGLPVTDKFVASVPEGEAVTAPAFGERIGQTLAGPLSRRNFTTTNRRIVENARVLNDPTDVSTSLTSFKSSTLAREMRDSANR